MHDHTEAGHMSLELAGDPIGHHSVHSSYARLERTRPLLRGRPVRRPAEPYRQCPPELTAVDASAAEESVIGLRRPVMDFRVGAHRDDRPDRAAAKCPACRRKVGKTTIDSRIAKIFTSHVLTGYRSIMRMSEAHRNYRQIATGARSAGRAFPLLDAFSPGCRLDDDRSFHVSFLGT
jgi:hypothetical protein